MTSTMMEVTADLIIFDRETHALKIPTSMNGLLDIPAGTHLDLPAARKLQFRSDRGTGRRPQRMCRRCLRQLTGLAGSKLWCNSIAGNADG